MNREKSMFAKATQLCEQILKETMRYNVSNEILQSENIVIEQFLERSSEMESAYVEIYEKLISNEQSLRVFLNLVVGCATEWNPKKLEAVRPDKKRLQKVNKEIAKAADTLSKLLTTRQVMGETTRVFSNTHCSVSSIIVAAAADNHLFKFYVENKIRLLGSQYDLKYWPSVAEIVGEIAVNARRATVEASDDATQSATAYIRASTADYFRAMFALISDASYILPKDFSLSDNSFATIANCSLNLRPDAIVDATYVKAVRHRSRKPN